MPTMRACDVVRAAQRFTNPDGHCFFANIQVRKPRHQGARVELIHLLFKESNHHHSAVHLEALLGLCRRIRFGFVRGNRHGLTPDICAKTSNTTAKSFSTRPIPRAAVRNSLVMAVVGMGMSSCLPRSRARSMSFCIMLTLNQACSGSSRTKGPRY